MPRNAFLLNFLNMITGRAESLAFPEYFHSDVHPDTAPPNLTFFKEGAAPFAV